MAVRRAGGIIGCGDEGCSEFNVQFRSSFVKSLSDVSFHEVGEFLHSCSSVTCSSTGRGDTGGPRIPG